MAKYDESSIKVLEGLEAVRKRPGMYIGSTDRRGLLHLIWEIVDNAVDEVINGYGNKIDIILHKDGSVSVSDEGRGVPTGKHASGKSTPEVIYTMLHAGGKFSEGGYKVSGGLHGVGASVVNALSKWMVVTIYRDGKIHEISFKDGGVVDKPLKQIGTTRKTGTTVRFLPDDSIFSTTNISFTSLVLELSVTGLKKRYPFLQTGSMGKSIMGKPLYYLKIGSGQNQVFYNASHHANEWITTPLLMKYIEKYAQAFSMGGSIFNTDTAYLYNTASLYIAPMVNPDGVDLVTGELNSGAYYTRAQRISENYPNIPFPNGWKANIAGIDPNLQYPAGWEKAREIKFSQGFTSPAPRDYVGSAPLEAPESRAVYDFTLSKDFSLTLSYHTQGQVIYWKYLDYLPERSFEIAQVFASVSGYALSETPTISGYAGYKDWFIYRYNQPGYTIEAGLGESPLPLSQFNEIYSDNEGILTYGLTATVQS